MSIKGIIFDKDGTLMDFEQFWIPVAEHSIEFLLKALGMDMTLKDKLLNEIAGDKGVSGVLCCGTYKDVSECFKRVLHENGFNADSGKLHEITREAFHSSICVGRVAPVCERLTDVICDFKSRGIKLLLATTDDEYITKKCLDKLRIAKYFDEIYTDDGLNPPKPNPWAISKICSDFGFEKDERVMVGDTLTDMNFAKNGGIKAIGVAKNERDKKIIEKGAAAVVNDVSYLAGALDRLYAV